LNGKKVKRLRREFIARYGRAPNTAQRPPRNEETVKAASAARLKEKKWWRYVLTLPPVTIGSEFRALKRAARRG
jgi:hypothetical protein